MVAVTTIEVALIITFMVSARSETASLARDTGFAASMMDSVGAGATAGIVGLKPRLGLV